MKAIELRAALIAANDINLNGADALVESSILKQLIESCKARVDEIEPAAKKLAEGKLAEKGETSGKFDHEGHHYTLDVIPVFDIIGKPQKYTMPEGVAFRQKTAEQQVLKAQSATITKILKTLRDNFPTLHPNIAPDSVEYTVVCVD